ncbi:MAG: PTS sugar transporter subunit IIA [Candidatus Omnitrophica bacterium]|jgi:fructose-specific phosphotransferase system IIA component|nr:PTS sugar transporter subunit IIA [Candidatus Omnitrophota bacterium]
MSQKNNILVSNLLKSSLIILELQSKDKKSVLLELVDLIAKSKKLSDKKAFSKAIHDREKLGSTGLGQGVAIPHAKSKVVKGFVLVFARCSEGIDFGALDGEKTYLFFSLASPQQDVGVHLKLLSEISRLVKDKFTVESLKKAKSCQEVVKIITAMEKQFPK